MLHTTWHCCKTQSRLRQKGYGESQNIFLLPGNVPSVRWPQKLQSLQGTGATGPARGICAKAPAQTKPGLCSSGPEVMHSPGELEQPLTPTIHHSPTHTPPCCLQAPAAAGEVQEQGDAHSSTLGGGREAGRQCAHSHAHSGRYLF